MKSNNFSAEKIIAWRDGRNGDGIMTTVGVENLGSPIVGIAGWHAHFGDLKPIGA